MSLHIWMIVRALPDLGGMFLRRLYQAPSLSISQTISEFNKMAAVSFCLEMTMPKVAKRYQLANRTPKQTYIRRRHLKKSGTNHQGKSSQNHTEILFCSTQNGYHQERKMTVNAGSVEKREPLHSMGGNVNQYSYYGKHCGSSLGN